MSGRKPWEVWRPRCWFDLGFALLEQERADFVISCARTFAVGFEGSSARRQFGFLSTLAAGPIPLVGCCCCGIGSRPLAVLLGD